MRKITFQIVDLGLVGSVSPPENISITVSVLPDFCLPGLGIFIHSGMPEKVKLQIVQHEYGHFLDSKYGLNGAWKKILGSNLLEFYLMIGIPS